ncbi:Tm-1-like ATP-binding domain-containing protein [Paenibacillus sp. J22TS3]|uniref:Tm-1-like ATP-binding domain-containing protein n=1 Tax=Paenibacillus sp. J22TS3 TaxID=2807192 RepID=UPI001B1218EA|nr:Tm-1-like ATP-binding domain-containing protein [Paenibacillus sp. J22TS3]GIP22054.1 hypothetical protein J22TS3_23290 [Paenibacillus sp. J22TS3]
MSTVALLGTMDTKGTEYAYIRQCLEAQGLKTLLINVGVFEGASLPVDVTADEVAMAAGADLEELRAGRDRGRAISVMAKGAEVVLARLYEQRRIDGVLALGGSGGSSIACQGMRALPIGVPKVMVSTVAGSDVSSYVGTKDIVMIPSIVDISGINKISRDVLSKAAGAIGGMVTARVQAGEDKPLIAASMFGNTTEGVELAKAQVEKAGYEVLVFHCTGNGGRTMESLIESGMISGVLDITTTEWADELVGGIFGAGPDRLSAAAKNGIPAVVVPGCLDMVNFGARETVPARFEGRLFYQHNPNVTLMRTTPEECEELGKRIAEHLNQSTGPVSVAIPLRGISVISAEDQPFYWPEADEALFRSLKKNLRPGIPVAELDCNINDAPFAEFCAKLLLTLIEEAKATV